MKSSHYPWDRTEDILRVATYLTGGLAIVTTVIWAFNVYGSQALITVRAALSPTFMGLVIPLYYAVLVLVAIFVLPMALTASDRFFKSLWVALDDSTEPPSSDRRPHPTIPTAGAWDPEEHVRKRYIKGLIGDETFERELEWAMTAAPTAVERPPAINEGPDDIDDLEPRNWRQRDGLQNESSGTIGSTVERTADEIEGKS